MTLRYSVVIPARSGSTGLKHKNIREFNGAPLMSWTIRTALKLKRMGMVEDVIVLTDSEDYMKIAREYGARTPVRRADHVSQTLSGDHEWFTWFVDWQRTYEPSALPDCYIHLRCTSPVSDEKEILDCMRRWGPQSRQFDSLRSVSRYRGQSPYKFYTVDEHTQKAQPLFPRIGSTEELYNSARQKLPDVFWDNGRVNILNIQKCYVQGSISGSNILSYETPGTPVEDIDDLQDFYEAERAFQST